MTEHPKFWILALLLIVTSVPAAAQDDDSATLLARIQQLRTEVADAEQKVANYHAAHPNLGTVANVDQHISMTLAQLAAIDSETARRDLQLQALKTLNDSAITTETVAATGDASLMTLSQARDALQAERTELAKTFRRAHPTMVEMQAKLYAAEQALSAAAAGALQSATADAEARAEQRGKLEATLAELQNAATGSAIGRAELSTLERTVDTARLQLEMHLAQYLAPVTPTVIAEPHLAVPPIPKRPSTSGLQSLIMPVGIGVLTLLALVLQGSVVKRRSYRRGFADGWRQAAIDNQQVAEWQAEEAADTDVLADRQVA